jgi:hypothetical protein
MPKVKIIRDLKRQSRQVTCNFKITCRRGMIELPAGYGQTGNTLLLFITRIMESSKHLAAGWFIEKTRHRKMLLHLELADCSGRLLIEDTIRTSRVIARHFQLQLRLLDHIPSQHLIDCGRETST